VSLCAYDKKDKQVSEVVKKTARLQVGVGGAGAIVIEQVGG